MLNAVLPFLIGTSLILSVPVERGRQMSAHSANNTHSSNRTLPANNTDESGNNCYFSTPRKNPLENQPRPEKSVVSESCSGSEMSMDEVASKYESPSISSEHPLALLLCRGAGLCELDFTDSKVLAQWKNVKICSHHADELLLQWSITWSFLDKHVYRRKMSHGKTFACSMPEGLGFSHDHRTTTHLRPLTISEANAILKEKNILVHPGIPICKKHQDFVGKLFPLAVPPSPKKPRYEIDNSGASEDDQCTLEQHYFPYDYHADPTKRDFRKFAASSGISRACSTSPWSLMQVTTRERKASAARHLFDSMLSIMVPDNTEEFKKIVERKIAHVDSWTSGSSADLEAIMNEISANYFASEDRNSRIVILSLVANSVSYLKVEKYIPGLSEYMYQKAKRFARRDRSKHVIKETVLEKYNRDAVEAFVQFITRQASFTPFYPTLFFSPTVLIGLPYGVRKVELSSGSKFDIPNSIRQQTATEIIEMYKTICEVKVMCFFCDLVIQDNKRPDLLLGTSTMYKMLKVCAASKRVATTCVDYFIASGMESFDGLHEILDYWKGLGLFDAEVVKEMKKELFQAAQYLRTDYRLHVKNVSRIADHCATFALSDAEDTKLAKPCSSGSDAHVHDLRCDRCEQMKQILETIEAHAKEFVAEEKKSKDANKLMLMKHEEELELIKKYKKHIFEMKKHLLRAAVTNEERRNITADLQDNEALLTLDFAQKFLPKWHREKQSDYFGKKGISYHISHITARVGDVFAQHSFVHIYEGSVTQDNKLVVLTLSHFLPELKKVGIKKVFLRSDNAGAYHSASTIGSLHWLMQTTGMSIGSYTFSEAQNGKSSSDRDANRVKRKVKEYINKGNDVTTSKDFFKALKENPPNGVSVYHGGVTVTEDGKTDWKGISTLNYFVVEDNGIRARKYGVIGVGTFVEKSNLKPIKGTVAFGDEAGFLASKIDSDVLRSAERDAVQKGLKTSFWYYPKCSTSKCLKEPDEVSPIVQESVPTNAHEGLYSCPEQGCSSTFLKYSNLEKHMLRGKHNKAPERFTERDYALNLFAQNLEKANAADICPVVEVAVKKMAETKNEDRLQAGWALPEKRTRKTFGKKVVDYLVDRFNEGAQSKKPMNPIVVSELMRTSKQFTADELLDARQIAGFFSREADRRRHVLASSTSTTTLSSTKTRRHLRRSHSHRQRHMRSHRSTTQASTPEYVEAEEEHPESGLISFMRSEEFWNDFDEFFDAVLENFDQIFLPIN